MLLRRRPKAPSSRPSTAIHVPRPGTVVALELVDVDRVWRSQVEEQQGARLVVLAPHRPGGPAILPEAGRSVTVGWPTQIGYLEADAVVSSTQDGEFATWTLSVSDSALSQRRSAYRLETQLPASIFAETVGQISGHTRNISEGGVACQIPGRHDVDRGDPVGVHVELPDGQIQVRGRVVRSAAMVPDGTEVVVAFEAVPDPVAERLRQHVFEQQLAQRAAER